MNVFFEWDEKKAENNLKKHGIRFEEAAKVFDDPFLVTAQDRIEDGEVRWQSLGLIDGVLLVLVAHTVRDGNAEIVRIISARRANRKERQRYEHG